MAFRRLELDERKIEGWDYRHREFSEIMEETLNWRAVRQPKSIEEVILEEERAELLQRIISKLPEMQRRRFLLHYEYEMTYKEIGKIEHCSQQSVGRAGNCRKRKGKGRDEEIPKRMTVKHTLVPSDMRVFALCSLMELHRS